MYRLWRRRADPAARERRRRVRVNATGRIVDGTIIDIQQTEEGQPASTTRLVFYEYSVRGEWIIPQRKTSVLLTKPWKAICLAAWVRFT